MRLINSKIIQKVREEFPALKQKIHGNPLVYLDNAATTQTHYTVIEAINHYYRNNHANPHRSTHYLANKATRLVEETREKVKSFLNAEKKEEIIFTSNATAAFNLLAHSYQDTLKEGDEVIISQLEHHSNWLPWERLVKRKKCKLRILPSNLNGELNWASLPKLINHKTRLVAITYVSHITGKKSELSTVIQQAHDVGAHVIVDAVQAAPHINIDVQALDTDFLIFSGHKLYGPTGVGVLYGKKKIMDDFYPYQLGGGTVKNLENATWHYEDLPYRLEAGTLPVASIVGLGAAIDFLKCMEKKELRSHVSSLAQLASHQLEGIPKLTLTGSADRISIVSFYAIHNHPLDIALQLSAAGIAVRAGQHCAFPALRKLDIAGLVRASFAIYNTEEEVNKLAQAVKSIVTIS